MSVRVRRLVITADFCRPPHRASLLDSTAAEMRVRDVYSLGRDVPNICSGPKTGHTCSDIPGHCLEVDSQGFSVFWTVRGRCACLHVCVCMHSKLCVCTGLAMGP